LKARTSKESYVMPNTLKTVFYGFSLHLLQVENHSGGGSFGATQSIKPIA
jgi:hypothetical protein